MSIILAFFLLVSPGAVFPTTWQGYYQAEGNETLSIYVQPDRIVWAEDGAVRLMLLLIEQDEDSFFVWRMGRKTALQIRKVDNDLEISAWQDKAFTFKKVSTLPRAFAVRPLPLDNRPELEHEEITEIRAELIRRMEEEQQQRSVENPDWQAMKKSDQENQSYLRETIQIAGWIDAERFGSDASLAAFLIVQHSLDMHLMRGALPHIKKDVEAGRLEGSQYCLLYDRLALMEGNPQRFGSQIAEPGEDVVWLLPTEDPENLNFRRSQWGLPPQEEYTAHFGSKVWEVKEDPLSR